MIYQLTFIVQDEKDKEIATKTVTAVGGTVLDERVVGQRKLVYPIKKLTEGIYITDHIDIDASALDKLDQKLRFEDKIIRFLIVKTEKVIKPTQAELPAVVEKPKVQVVIEPKKVTKEVVKKPVKKEVAPSVDQAKRLKTLEEKLQELLKE